MSLLEDLLAQVVTFCGVYGATITLVTAVTAALLATVILYLHHLVLPDEKWAKYFGWAFAIFTIQYAIGTSAGFARNLGFEADFIDNAQRAAQALGSTANNLCFLVAARILLSRKKALPMWVVAAALAAACAELISATSQTGTEVFLLRLPDSLFSAYCLGFLGWAMYVNFGPKRHPRLAALNLLGGSLYGSLNLAFAVNPLIATEQIWPVLVRRIELALDAFNRMGITRVSVLTSLDSFVFGCAFVLKIWIFLGALLLIINILLVLSPKVARGLLAEITTKRGKYLTDQGILKAIGESTEADLVALCIRLPGVKTERVAWWRWLRYPVLGKKPLEMVDLPSAEKSIVAWILRTGLQEVSCPDRWRDSDLNQRYLPYVEDMVSFAAVPIRYHGAVIAVLNLEWKEPSGYSATTVQRIHQLAELLAPTVAFRRQLLSMDRLAEEFRSPNVSLRTEEEPEPLKKLVVAVHDSVTPLATGFLLDLGFRWAFAGCNDQLTILDVSERDDAQNPLQRLISLATARKGEEPEIYEESLVIQGVHIGKLLLAIAPVRDPVNRPSLADGHLHRRTVASLLANSLLDTVHHRLTAILNRLQVDLNRSGATVSEWFESIEMAARDAGLQWIVATVSRDQTTSYHGGESQKELVGRLHEEVLGLSKWGEPILPFALSEPVESAKHVLVLPLRNAHGELWLGLGRPTFTRELSFSSPWRTFLLGFVQTCDSALARIERHRLQLETKQLETATTRVETSGLLMHTLGNDVAALLLGIERLEEMLPGTGAPMTEDLRNRVVALRKSAQSLRQLSATFKAPIPSDTRRKVQLIEVIDRIRGLYEENLKAKEIELVVDVSGDLIVGVPLEVAYIALVTLLVNAAEGIRRKGKIFINAKNGDEAVLCHVDDNGPGIKDEFAENIFDLGFSTKRNGTGLGLPLARNALRRYGGDLFLVSGQPEAVRFTIRFPE